MAIFQGGHLILSISSDIQEASKSINELIGQKSLTRIDILNIAEVKEKEAMLLFREAARLCHKPIALNISLGTVRNELIKLILTEVERNSYFTILELTLGSNELSNNAFAVISEALIQNNSNFKVLKLELADSSCIPVLAQFLKQPHTIDELYISYGYFRGVETWDNLKEVFQALMLAPRSLRAFHFGNLVFSPEKDKDVQQKMVEVLQESFLESFSLSQYLSWHDLPVTFLNGLDKFPGESTLRFSFRGVNHQHTFGKLAKILPLGLTCLEIKILTKELELSDNDQRQLLKNIIYFIKSCNPSCCFHFKLQPNLVLTLNDENSSCISEIKRLLSKTGISFTSSFLNHQPLQNRQLMFFSILAKARRMHIKQFETQDRHENRLQF
ncbi:hypothetical protein [Legionella jordanis]|uniref:Uncharacterized protein n=1 Tax=Legionella jordanis TaxID=456 RepID=A0A0W0V7S9_9GAMM|nr:hypothetical protein [Legionella jordanis]KTD16193.1 hypothetical protein Ljor_0499 [Legionella jordanis]RMX04586.1 hypothetical protein EAW55_03890 [Legionella jordanis]VEH12349.1 Uncharacterised protein [Legionella jordanis]